MEVRKMKIVIINGSAGKGNSGTGENRRKYMST